MTDAPCEAGRGRRRVSLLRARRVARGALPWTSGTSSSPSQTGTLLRRHMAGFYSAVDNSSVNGGTGGRVMVFLSLLVCGRGEVDTDDKLGRRDCRATRPAAIMFSACVLFEDQIQSCDRGVQVSEPSLLSSFTRSGAETGSRPAWHSEFSPPQQGHRVGAGRTPTDSDRPALSGSTP